MRHHDSTQSPKVRRRLVALTLLLATFGCSEAGHQANVFNGLRTAASPTTSSTTTYVSTSEPTTASPGETSEAVERLEATAISAGECGTVIYTPSGSTPYEADICLPENRTSDTVVILVHGGGGTGGTRSDLRAWQDAYSEMGYVTLNVDYRLTDADTDQQVWPEPEQNLKAAVQFVRLLEPTLGTSQVVVQGHSAGARLGSVVYTTPDDPAFGGAELWNSVSDRIDGFIGFYGYYDGYQFEYSAYYGTAGSPSAASAIENAAQASGDALLITGDIDALIDTSQSHNLTAALEGAGMDAQTVVVSDQGHGFDIADGALTADGWAMAALIDDWLRATDDLT